MKPGKSLFEMSVAYSYGVPHPCLPPGSPVLMWMAWEILVRSITFRSWSDLVSEALKHEAR